MTDLVIVKALAAFSIFHEGVGIVHGDPDSTDEKAQFPQVPEGRLAELIDQGKIEELPARAGAPKVKAEAPAAAAPDKRKAALAKANAARAAKRAAKKSASPPAPTPTPTAGSGGSGGGSDEDAPAE